jgi:hypothetical protein
MVITTILAVQKPDHDDTRATAIGTTRRGIPPEPNDLGSINLPEHDPRWTSDPPGHTRAARRRCTGKSTTTAVAYLLSPDEHTVYWLLSFNGENEGEGEDSTDPL